VNFFVADGMTGAGITDATWNYNYYNYHSGWYYIAVGDDTWVTVQAPAYISATFNTNTDDPNNAGTIYLARQSSGGGKK
jgi:hypothetical protein